MKRLYIISAAFLFTLGSTYSAQAGRPPWDDTKKPSEKKSGDQKPPDKQGNK
jgi:hypothetical protein